MNDTVKEVAEKYCPSHNEMAEDESHFHCEECAGAIRGRFEDALREMRNRTLEEAAATACWWCKHKVPLQADGHIENNGRLIHMCRATAIRSLKEPGQ